MFKKIIALIFATMLFIPSLSLASLGDDGISCVQPGTYYTASWDNRYGQANYPLIAAGSHWPEGWNCNGMCGGGCNNLSMGDYTLDCLEHDICGFMNGATGGKDDPNCGDEFREAQDDWFGAGFKCRKTHAAAYVAPVNNAYYRIRQVRSGKYIEVSNYALWDGGNVQQWSWTGSYSQQWQLVSELSKSSADQPKQSQVQWLEIPALEQHFTLS